MTARRILPTLTLMLLPLAAAAQQSLLAGNPDRTALYLNPAKVWNYNHYEHSRWGAGLRLTTHPSWFIFNQIDADVYLGYGLGDEQWKWGVGLEEHLRGSRINSTFYQRYTSDYRGAGSRRIGNPWTAGGSLLGDFMASRMISVRSATLGYHMQAGSWRWALEATGGKRGYLFDDNHLIYANLEDVTYSNFIHLRLMMRHACGIGAQLEVAPDGSMARLLAEYKRNIELTHFNISIYAQGGLTPERNEYIDMFDLGGMWSSPLYVSNQLATARPNEFTANAFTLLHMQIETARPLFRLYSSLFNVGINPSPFVGITAAWGALWGQDADGQRPWLGSYLQAPHRGILEPTLGLNGIIRFGVVDWGAAISYRLTPSDAPYSYTDPYDNLMLIVTAKLLI